MEFHDIQKQLKKVLKPNRYTHTMGVVETARKLAGVHKESVDKAALAALLHDCAKSVPDDEKILMCKDRNIEITDAEYQNPSLLHAKCGAILAKELYEVTDDSILHAIRVHTTGCCNMNTLDQIIFISDYIEPNRDKAPNLKKLREMANVDLTKTTYYIMRDTVRFLNTRKDQAMDPTTYEAYQYYKALVKK